MIFQNRIDAGKKLAQKLQLLKYENPLVLAIPRGGVILGDIIASSLGCKLDIIVSRKIGAPSNPELAIGAIMQDGSFFPNEKVINILEVLSGHIQTEKIQEMKEIKRRLLLYRGSTEYNISYKTIIIVDDGIATGATISVASMWAKKQHPKKVVIAAPVGASETIKKLESEVDKVIVLHVPDYFNAVGQFYKEFDQVEDSEVQKIMRKYGYEV